MGKPNRYRMERSTTLSRLKAALLFNLKLEVLIEIRVADIFYSLEL